MVVIRTSVGAETHDLEDPLKMNETCKYGNGCKLFSRLSPGIRHVNIINSTAVRAIVGQQSFWNTGCKISL